MKVIDFSAEKAKRDAELIAARRNELLLLLDELKAGIESGDIDEFVACSVSKTGGIQTFIGSENSLSSIGLFELGKFLIITEDLP